MQALFLLLQDNPAALQGFIGGVIGAVLVEIVSWRWTIRKRRHPADDST